MKSTFEEMILTRVKLWVINSARNDICINNEFYSSQGSPPSLDAFQATSSFQIPSFVAYITHTRTVEHNTYESTINYHRKCASLVNHQSTTIAPHFIRTLYAFSFATEEQCEEIASISSDYNCDHHQINFRNLKVNLLMKLSVQKYL